MKKPYNKPEVSVEIVDFDQPIAANCETTKEDMLALESFGYFTDGCAVLIDKATGRIDANKDGKITDDEVDTVCYHSNVTQAWYS